MFVNRLRPDLLDDKGFINSFFASWRSNLGESAINEMKIWSRSADTFTHVTNGLERYINWYRRPLGGANMDLRKLMGHTVLGFIGSNKNHVWIPCANNVIKTIKQNRNLIGI